MAPDTPTMDDDVSPEDFLKRVREMTLERDREDRQRAADLEKDIIQSREQRRARRAGEYHPNDMGLLDSSDMELFFLCCWQI